MSQRSINMKVTTVAFAFLLAAVSAMPNLKTNELESAIRSGETRLVTGNIEQAINDVAESIREAGLDPFNIHHLGVDYATPVPTVFNARAHVQGMESTGLSNIVINTLSYGVITSRLTLNLELPRVDLRVDDSAWDVNVLSGNLNGAFSGSIALRSLVILGNIRVNIGLITGISIREIDMQIGFAGIESNLRLILQGWDVSEPLNHYLGWTVPNAFEQHKDDINELFTMVAREMIEANL